MGEGAGGAEGGLEDGEGEGEWGGGGVGDKGVGEEMAEGGVGEVAGSEWEEGLENGAEEVGVAG